MDKRSTGPKRRKLGPEVSYDDPQSSHSESDLFGLLRDHSSIEIYLCQKAHG
jgi:hypothetical protein